MQNNDPNYRRRSLAGYNLQFLDGLNIALSAATFTAYLIFCTSNYGIEKFGSELIITSIFVLYGMVHYLRILMVDNSGDDPTFLILTNRTIQMTLLAWVGSFITIIYF